MTIGERLKSAREAKGITLEDAAQFTKIQRRILQAIEQDRAEEALDLVYAKIFLKKYAGFLGLDGPALVAEYQGFLGPAPKHSIAVETEITRTGEESSLKRMLLPVGGGALFVIGFSFLGYLAFDLYGTLTSSRAPVPGPTSSRQVDRPRAMAKAAAPSSKPREAENLLVPRAQPLRLTIRTKSDVWMQVRSDGSVIFQNVLAKGSQESWIAKQELELWTGNAGAMELALNGKPLGSPGTGVKKGIRITHSGMRVPE